MMEEISSEQCNMCSETEIPETISCCEENNFAGEILTSGSFTDCCNTQVIENKVEDDFLYLKQEVNNDQCSIVIVLPASLLVNDIEILKSTSSYTFDSSPPSRKNDLYNYNSVLLF